jgi:hypothetical protein
MEEAGNQGAMGSARPAARAPDREQGAPWEASSRGRAGAVRGGAGHLNEQPWGTKEGERQPWRYAGRASGLGVHGCGLPVRRPWRERSGAGQVRLEVEEGLGRHPWERLEERDAMAAGASAPAHVQEQRRAARERRRRQGKWLVAARGVGEKLPSARGESSYL